MTTQRGTKMTAEHKAAMSRGRAEGRAIRDYLQGLRDAKPKPGRKRTPESINKRLATIESTLDEASPLEELKLVQERRDLQAELEAMGDTIDLAQLEDAFVDAAKAYGERKGIAYASWREVGVPAAVLKRAGISRSD